MAATPRIVVSGGVAAGMSAASQARRRRPDAEVLVLERGPYVSYGACGLPCNIADPRRPIDDLVVLTPERFRSERGIDVRTRQEALAIDAVAKTVLARDPASGREYTLAYDKLVIATGASAVRPPLPGLDLPGVFLLRELTEGTPRRPRSLRTSATPSAPGSARFSGEGAERTERGPRRHVSLDCAASEPYDSSRVDRRSPPMESTLAVHRLTFAFTINYHYLFPQLTMGLAFLIVILKTLALRTGDARYDHAARFWARLFAISFAMGVVTGIPMEFQFGTSWARFSKATGAVIGHLLAMEGVFSFFLESTFLGLFLYGEKRLSPRAHWLVSIALWLGTWLSGYFITATNAWMQHPVGFTRQPDGSYALASLGALLANPWLLWQYPHTMSGSLVTASFVMASIGAFYLLARRHEEYGRLFLRLAVPAGAVAAVAMAFPTGDGQGKMVARHQPVALAAMEGLFETKKGAPIVLIGQPDIERLRLDNPVEVPRMLSFLTYNRWEAEVKGLDAFPRGDWPDHIPLLYYAYHIMVGLGTLFIAVMAAAAFLLRGGRLFRSRPMLWLLMLMLPLPFIANNAGWITAELGRQPWLVYGLLRTADGSSAHVSTGNGLFVLLGFMGIYTVLGILYLFLASREIEHGPAPAPPAPSRRGE